MAAKLTTGFHSRLLAVETTVTIYREIRLQIASEDIFLKENSPI
jgi:hypothetical protein